MSNLKIAIVPLQRLGDGVVSLIIANNLHNNNYSVCMMHKFMHHMNEWFDFTIKDYPEHECFEDELSKFDIVFMDMCVPYILSKSEAEQKKLSEQYIFYAVGQMNEDFIHDHTQRLISRLGEDSRASIENLTKVCRTIKYQRHHSMVDNMTLFCQETLQLPEVSIQAGIKIPENIFFQKNNKRVILAPTSSLEKKNWSRKKFVLLANLLKKQGYQPIFAVSMDERLEWLKIVDGKFDVPEFITIKDYAEYLYESLCLIGNDSGGGHLASLVGIPVLTIVTSPKKLNFRWRPGWGHNAVVAPNMTFKFMGKRHWHPFLSVKKVFTQFKQLIKDPQ